VLAAAESDVIGFVGCGPINVSVAQFLASSWPGVRQFMAFDLDPERSRTFREQLCEHIPGAVCTTAASLEALLSDCSMVSFGTTAIKPYVDNLDASPAGATILHVSLRDLSAGTVLSNHNIVDDLDHVNRAATSIHLASTQTGNTDFVHGSLGDLLLGNVELPERDERKVIFSPFGLGVLDLAVADMVQRTIAREGGGTVIESFLP
jgi:ornithine cyclodeaminase